MTPIRPGLFRRPRRLAAVSLLLAACGAGAALRATPAPCALGIERLDPLAWSGRAGRGYDPLDPAERWQQGWLVVRHEGKACDFTVAVGGTPESGDRRASGPGGGFRYRLTGEDGQPLRELPSATGGGLLAGRFEEGPSLRTLAFRLSGPAGQRVPAGTYRDAVRFRLHAAAPGEDPLTGAELATRILFVTVDVQPGVELSFEGVSGGGRELTLGEIARGASRSFRILVDSASPCRLEVRSANGGYLLRDGAAAAGGDRIPYSLRIGGREATPGEGAVLALSLAPGPTAAALEVEVVVAAAPGAAAGDYADTLFFSVEAE